MKTGGTLRQKVLRTNFPRFFSSLFLFSLPLFILTLSPNVYAEYTGIVIASDVSRGIVLANIEESGDIFSGDTAILTRGSSEVVRGKVSEIYTDSLRISIGNAPSDIDGVEVKITPSEENVIRRAREIMREKFSGSFTTGFSSYAPEGRTPTRSFYDHGTFFYHDLDLNYGDQLTENVGVEMNANIRYTDDMYYEIENFSAKRLRVAVKEKDDQYGFVLGDEYTYLSHYTLSQSLKGVKAYERLKSSAGTTSLTTVFGVNNARWNDFFEDQEFETYQRYVTGVRLEQEINEHAKLGFNFADSRDDEGTSDSSGANPVHNDVFSWDSELHLFDRLNARGEVAYAWTDSNAKNPRVSNKGDLGTKLDADLLVTDFDYFTNRLYYGYEYAGENLSALSGILKTDREEHYFRHRADIGEYVSTKYQFNHFHNNTKDGLATSTRTRKHELELTLRPIPGHPQTELSTILYVTRRKSSDKTTVDNYTRSMYWKLKSEIKNITVWGGYQLGRKADDITLPNGRRTHTVDVGLRGHLNINEVRISPLASVEIEQEASPLTRSWGDMVRLRLGSEARYKGTSFRFYYLLRDENNQILNDVEERNVFDIELEHYLFGDPSRVISADFRRDDRWNKASARNYGDNMLSVKFTQYFD